MRHLSHIPRLSSRHRVTLRIVVALAVIWAIGGMLTHSFVRSEMLDSIDEDLRDTASSTAAVIDAVPDVVSVGNETRVGSRDEAMLIIGPEGMVLKAPSGSDDRPDPLPDVSQYSSSQLRGRSGEPFTVGDAEGRTDRYRVVTAPLANGSVLVSAQSLRQVRDMESILAHVLTIGSLLSIGLVIMLVWIINRQALKPLEDVIDTAHAVGAGSLDTRVEVHSSAPDVERLGDAMNTMLERLQQAFADKELSEARLRQFVADASHELRTPLAAVIGYAELYQEHIARTPEQVDHAMERIVAEGTRMQSLVEDLLLLARLDEGRQLARDAVDLSQVVDDAVAAITTIDRRHEFVLEPAEEPVDVVGDAVALRQVIDNLLTNVVNHTPEGTRAVVSLTTDRLDVLLVVGDNGPGMSAEDRARAFDRFWRAERGRSRPGGSGLGLAIVAELVRAMGGTISLDAQPGEGCVFTIRLPRHPTARPVGVAEASAVPTA